MCIRRLFPGALTLRIHRTTRIESLRRTSTADTISVLLPGSNYLEHYGHVPRSLACASPALTSFTTASMKISYGPAKSRREWTHEFSPPMYAGEARKRLEAMHQDARKGLGIVSRLDDSGESGAIPRMSYTVKEALISQSDALSQSPAEVDRVVVTVPALISLVVCSSVLLAFSVPRPETIASAFSFQAQYLSPLLASIGLKRAYEPRTIGRVISLFWTGILLVAHVAEAFLCLPPLFRSYNVKSRSVQLAYVSLFRRFVSRLDDQLRLLSGGSPLVRRRCRSS